MWRFVAGGCLVLELELELVRWLGVGGENQSESKLFLVSCMRTIFVLGRRQAGRQHCGDFKEDGKDSEWQKPSKEDHTMALGAGR
jgi:hypothetical protein